MILTEPIQPIMMLGLIASERKVWRQIVLKGYISDIGNMSISYFLLWITKFSQTHFPSRIAFNNLHRVLWLNNSSGRAADFLSNGGYQQTPVLHIKVSQ